MTLDSIWLVFYACFSKVEPEDNAELLLSQRRQRKYADRCEIAGAETGSRIVFWKNYIKAYRGVRW